MAARVGGDREGGVRRGADHREAGGERGDAVAVAHPDLLAAGGEEAGEERVGGLGGGDVGAAELGGVAGFDLAAELGHHGLLAVADAEDRDAEGEDLGRGARAAGVGDAGRAAGEDDGLRAEGGEEGGVDLLVGVDLAVDADLAQAAGDQLGDLAAEVDDEEALVVGVRHRLRIGRRARIRKGEAEGGKPLGRLDFRRMEGGWNPYGIHMGVLPVLDPLPRRLREHGYSRTRRSRAMNCAAAAP